MAPRWSIVIPAYNEQEFLPLTLAMLRRALPALPGGAEVIVVDNNSTDATAAIARAAGARVVAEPVNRIARARNAGAAAARGGILVFLDADTRVLPAQFERMAAVMAEPRCGGGGFALVPDRRGVGEFARAIRLWNATAAITGMQAGCLQFVRRPILAAIGGFPEHLYAGEDAACSWRWARWCWRHGLGTAFVRRPPLRFNCRKFRWLDLRTRLKLLAGFAIGPLALRSRRICSFWYERPWQR
jgi:glycosyltransferase involved in cell wall biosynthesis